MKHCRFTLSILFVLTVCFASLAQNKDSSKYTVQRLAINSKHSDFSPFLYNNKLYFSSGREHNFGIKYSSIETDKELIDIFYAEKKDSVTFKSPSFFSEINTIYNDGPLCISKDGKQLFITQNDLARASKKNKKPLSVFISTKVNDKWSKPIPLSFCTGTYNYCHPTFSADGKTLYFSADIENGYGEMDIYYSTLENGIWTIPRNLGKKINTTGNEVFPFISENKTLYFSSNRSNGHGGLDIYAADLKDENTALQLLELPINSAYDDFGIWLDSTENTGYLSSSRDTLNKDDIFYVRNKYPTFENCTPYKRSTYCYTFFEEATIVTQDTLGMIYEWDFGDGIKKRGIEVKHCFAHTGNYSVQLNIIEKESGNLFYNELSYDFTVEEPPHLFIDCPDTLFVSKQFNIDIKKSIIQNHTIKKTYWFFGDGKFYEGDSSAHTYQKEGIYNLKLGVLAMNDSTKKIEKFCTEKSIVVKDSLWMSQNKNIVYIIKDENYTFADSLWKAKYNPYYNSKPSRADSLQYKDEIDAAWIARHKNDVNFIPENTDTLYSINQGDSVNFRIYLGSSKKNIPLNAKVFTNLNDVKKYKEKEGYSYTSGAYKKIENIIPEYKKAKQNGFKNAAVVGFYGDSLVAHQERSLKGRIVSPTEIKSEEEFPSGLNHRNILFDFDKAVINKYYYKYLDSLTTVLQKDRKYELIILAAADSVGSSSYNRDLSKKRAEAVQQYFIEKGISNSRLDINTFGENMPAVYDRNKIIVISNRRVEILLVKQL